MNEEITLNVRAAKMIELLKLYLASEKNEKMKKLFAYQIELWQKYL